MLMENNVNNSMRPGAHPMGFWLFETLAQQVPFSKRKLRQLIKDQVLPAIRLPHSRRLLFDPSAVAQALRRHSTSIN